MDKNDEQWKKFISGLEEFLTTLGQLNPKITPEEVRRAILVNEGHSPYPIEVDINGRGVTIRVLKAIPQITVSFEVKA